MKNLQIDNLLTKWVARIIVVSKGNLTIVIFSIIFVFLPSFAFASEKVIYQKNLWSGFKLIQTEEKISINFKNKKIYQESNSLGWDYWPSSMGDLENIVNASPENSREQELIEYAKAGSGWLDLSKIAKKYPGTYGILVSRLRLISCYDNTDLSCPKVLSVSKNWYQIILQNGYTSNIYYVHKQTGKSMWLDYALQSMSGKSGYYVLTMNDAVSNVPQKLYLFKDDGSIILQFEHSEESIPLESFELLAAKKIQLNFLKKIGSNSYYPGMPWEKFTKIIPVKVK